MADNVIGRCRCPVCKGTRASLRLSAKQLTYIVCNGCNVQVFARSDVSDGYLRSLLLANEPEAEPPETAPAPTPAPTPAAKPAAPVPAPAPTPTPEPPKPEGLGWGIFR